MTGTIIGVTVAVGVIMLALGAWGAFAWRSRRRQMKTGTDGRRGDDSGNPKTVSLKHPVERVFMEAPATDHPHPVI